MDRLLKFIGLATVIIGVGYSILHLKSNSDTFNEVLRIFGLVSAIALIGFIIARLKWGKNWIIKGGATMLVGSDLISAFKLFLDELPTPSKSTTANLSGHLVYRFTRLGVLGFLLALIPVVLLWQQNGLLTKQNEKIDTQIELDESSRRGNLIVMMSNIMDKVDDELTNDWNDDGLRNLSPQLVGRIAALSQSFRPYRFWQGSSLIEKPLSPERGQLLLALTNSKLDSVAYDNLFQAATFEKSYLSGADLNGADLNGANLFEANLIRANLIRANLSGADLSGANLIRADLNTADLRKADLRKADLGGADLGGADLGGADLRKASLGGADLGGADLSGADLRKANLSGANLIVADLLGADLSRADLSGTDLSGTDLSGANLSGANLFEANLSGADLSEIKVKEKDWLEKLQTWSVKETGTIEKYKADTTLQEDMFSGEHYHLIKKKQ